MGGILLGKDMIVSAEARKVMKQMEAYQTAVNTFRLKYNCLPGDCTTAANPGLGTSGNGDGVIGNCGAA